MMAVCFYGLPFGGFVALGLLGAISSLLFRALPLGRQSSRWIPRIVAIGFATAFCLLLATLDWYIGPW